MDFIQLYLPFFGSLSLLYFAFKAKFGSDEVLRVEKFGFHFVITKALAGRVAFLMGACSMFPYYLTMDYSKFFPTHMEVETFYDQDGIRETLKIFSEDELTNLGVIKNYSEYADEHYKYLDDQLKEVLRPFEKGFFSVKQGSVYSKGTTSIHVEKTDGIHNYYVKESSGSFTHILEAPKMKSISYLSYFEKKATSRDFIRPTVLQILIDREYLLSTEYKQILAEHRNSNGSEFDHKLLVATKLYLFPMPSFSNSVYLKEVGDKRIPIAYAVYK